MLLKIPIKCHCAWAKNHPYSIFCSFILITIQMIEKCSQYWPEKVGHTIRLHRTGMMITLKESKLFADYTINTLSLKQVPKGDRGKKFSL